MPQASQKTAVAERAFAEDDIWMAERIVLDDCHRRDRVPLRGAVGVALLFAVSLALWVALIWALAGALV